MGSSRLWSGRLALCLGALVGLPLALEAGFRLTATPESFFKPLSPKRSEELRLFVYGESIVWGAPEPAVGFVEQLRHALLRIYPRRQVSVVNYGVNGWTRDTAALAATTMSQSPDIVVVMSGGNEMGKWAPLAEPLPAAPKRGADIPERFRRLRESSAAVRTIKAWLTPRHQEGNVWPDRLVPDDRSDMSARLDRLRNNLRALLDAVTAGGAPVLLCTEPSNLRDWAPVHLRFPRPDAHGGEARYERVIHQIEALIAAKAYDEAQVKIGAATTAFGKDPMFVYLDARLQYARGLYNRARELFGEAKESEWIPMRMLDVSNEVIRESARRQGVRLVDVYRLFMERSAGGTTGFDLMADNGHPNPYGGAVIAGALVEEIREFIPSDAGDQPCCDADEFLRAVNFVGSPLEVSYMLFRGRYSMKTPFYEFSVSRDSLNRVVQIDPRNWEAWANLATLSLFEGNVQQGRAELEKATALKGTAIDPTDRAKTPYLAEALRASVVR